MLSFVSIREQFIPFVRDGKPITLGKFDGDKDPVSGCYVHRSVARLDKGIPNPKVRPVLPLEWALSFTMISSKSGNQRTGYLESCRRRRPRNWTRHLPRRVWKVSVESDCAARRGLAAGAAPGGEGTARHGRAALGSARHGEARRGSVKQGKARNYLDAFALRCINHGVAWRVTARRGGAGLGVARKGRARQGKAWRGQAKQGKELLQ